MKASGGPTHIASTYVLFNHTQQYSIFFADVDYGCSANIILVTRNYSQNWVGKYGEDFFLHFSPFPICWIDVYMVNSLHLNTFQVCSINC